MINPILENDAPVEWMSLDDYVGQGSDSIIYVRVRGEAMPDIGINSGDLVVVDRLAKPAANNTVLCETNGSYTIKKFSDIKTFVQPLRLIARNGQTVEMAVKRQSVKIVGVVTFLIKNLGGAK